MKNVMVVERFYSLSVLALLAMLSLRPLSAQMPPVRIKEGPARGFLTLRDGSGHVIAAGDLTETVHGGEVHTRLTFHFKDGSLDDETTDFMQGGSFHVIRDRHIQKGPSFPEGQEIVLDTVAQQISFRDANKNVPAKPPEHFDLPPDVCNGIVLLMVKNLRPADAAITLPYLAFSGKPRLVHLAMQPEERMTFRVGGHAYPAERYLIKVELGGLAGVVAPIIGKEPSDLHVWIAEGAARAVIRLDAALYFGGPIWSIQLATPSW